MYLSLIHICSVRVDFVDAVEACAGRGDEHIAVGSEGDVVRGNTRFERGEDENLAVAGNLEDGSAAVADIKILVAIEGDSGGDPHAFGVGRHGAVGRDFVDGFVVARRNVHLTLAVEGNRGGVHQIAEKRLDVVVGVDLENRYGNFLSARSGKRHIEVALPIHRGIGNRMKIVGNRNRNFDGMSVADVAIATNAVRTYHDWPRRRCVGHAGDHEFVGADQHRAFHLAEAHAGPA